jgi:hypothetical protein
VDKDWDDSSARWDGQKKTRGQSDEPNGGNNQVCQSHGEFKNKIDDDPIDNGKDESMEENLCRESSAWGQRKQKAWAQESKEDSWYEYLGTCNVDHRY